MIGLNDCLLVSAALFATGVAGVVLRRNALIMLMSLELALNAANLAVVAFARFGQNIEGQLLAFFVIAIAAAEVAVGLAIVVSLHRLRSSTNVDTIRELRA
ncbi:MAG: NADH-quinone oxidoreductase chain dehydrogenase chain chain [Pseudomonadota bacterium]|jgi:NADH-quinone oxidoreductase subunit K